MKFSLIICTYMRPKALAELLNSVKKQSLYPDEILIIDGSLNDETELLLKKNPINNLAYYKVEASQRGLTKQRNVGISKLADDIDIVCFLDDDTILNSTYFEKLIGTYSIYSNAIAVGGYITNEVNWKNRDFSTSLEMTRYDEFEIDGFVRKIGQRNVLRKSLGLLSSQLPGIMPEFSNGFSISFLPPTNKVYEVEYFMGGVSSYKKEVFNQISFSNYFEGYGLYEDLDFCLRVSKLGKLYVNTAAKLGHFHNEEGRPNSYKYGKMVVRNGWYVWRVKYPNPSLNARFKWNAIVFVQIFVRGLNIFTAKKKTEVLSEFVGRKIGWFSLIFNKPKIKE